MRLSESSGIQFPLGQILILVLIGASCTQPTPAPEAARPTPADVARINDETIPFAELEQFLRDEGLGSGIPEERQTGFSRLVRQKVLAQEAHRAGFAATPQEADQIGWVADSNQENADPERTLRQALDYLAIQKFLLDRLQSDQEIDLRSLLLHYEQNWTEYQIDDQYRVLEILVQEEAEAERIRKQLRPGDFRQFRELAKAESTGVAAEWGGDLGLFKEGELPPRFEEAVFALKVGEISEIFQSELGRHIFTIEEFIPRHAQKFYEVQEQIFEQLVAERERQDLDEIVNKIVQSASIEIFDPSLSRDWREGDVQLP